MAPKCQSSYRLILAKVFIDGAEFDISPPCPTRTGSTGISLKKYAFIDTPREETVKLPNYALDTPPEETVNLPNYALIDEVVITGFYRPPPPYNDDNEFSQNISLPAYDPKDPNRIKRRKLREFTEEYYLPNYMEIEWLDYLGPGCIIIIINNNNLILILRAFHEMIKRALHDLYL